MTLIKSISGIRGTIGGIIGDNLTPIDIINFTISYGLWIKLNQIKTYNIVIGRDARLSGKIISNLIISTLQFLGINVIDLGLTTTPTLSIMILHLNANGGIMITASHNTQEWNALKLFNFKGEMISKNEGIKILLKINKFQSINFSSFDTLGKVIKKNNAIDIHIKKILELDLVNVNLIKKKKFKIVVDCINSTGGISLVPLLKKLGCEVIEMYTNPNGFFSHNPEPLFENLSQIMTRVPQENANLGIAVDPDVDRLVFINEDGTFFGEEYTLIVITDYVLQNKKGTIVSNISSSLVLEKIASWYKQKYFFSKVGEVNVVNKMKEVNAVIGGEGNGGIIYPKLHYGRDALVGVSLFLTFLAKTNKSIKELKNCYPIFFMSKKKIELTGDIDINLLFFKLKEKYKNYKCIKIDGLKIFFLKSWIHFRKSNTESILRIYSEAASQKKADNLIQKFIKEIELIINI